MNLRPAFSLGGLIGGFLLVLNLNGESVPSDKITTESFENKIRPFLQEYCIQCHGPDKQKGERRFDSLAYPVADDNALIDFQDMLDLLNLGDMPPEEETQPGPDERQAVVDWLTRAVSLAHELRTLTDGETVLRRLNHREYFNTISDLFQMDMSMFDPTEAFPGERLVEHQDNVGDTLVTSGYLLDQYINAADQIVEKALPFQEKPDPQTWTFNKDFEQQPELNKRHMTAHGQRYLNIYEAPNTIRRFGAYAPLLAFKDGVPEGGFYTIRILAEAVNRFHTFDRKKVINDPGKPMMLRVIPGNKRFGAMHLPQPFAPDLGTFALSDEGPAWYTTEAWLDKGFSPRFVFLNGSMDIRPAFRLVTKLVTDNPDPSIPKEDLEEDYMAVAVKHGGIPHIRIHEVEISGPFYNEWPTPSWKTILGKDSFNPKKTRKIIQQFASRAYRRPVGKEEVNRLMRVVEVRIEQGHSAFEGMKDGLKAALCSPAFLYLEEEKESNSDRLTDYGLASRLSYFLWGSSPDQELLNLAKRKRLRKPAVLQSQTDRMLNDPRSDRFVSGFLDSWLTLRNLGDAPPDRNKFEIYYQTNLEESMRKETELFARNALDENLPISCFLDADFTFVNESLAKLYGIEDFEGAGFRRIEINDPRRGGLLGQASILTVTANGVDTSPVLRGVWLLENLLGTPPSPPPPDVEPLNPDVRGAKTIRDQLAKHRETQACFECHRKIDPLGFALENFDPIGQWRDTYGEDRAEIDASGELPSGEGFEDIVEFKKALMNRQDTFTRALVGKMLAYAIGRRVEIMDRPVIDKILTSLDEDGGGFRDLVHRVVLSEPFARP